MRRRLGIACGVALAGVMLAPVAVFAQLDAPLWTVTTVEARDDMALELEELLKERRDHLAASGATEWRVAAVVRGRAYEYLLFAPHNTFAELEERRQRIVDAVGEVALTQWVARVEKTTKNRRTDTLRLHSDLSIPLADGRTPTLAVLRTERLRAGVSAHQRWLTEKWLPALHAAEIDGIYQFTNALAGRITYQLHFIDNWAGLDSRNMVEQLNGTLGPDDWLEFGSVTEIPDVRVLRLRPDLSIMP